MLRSLEWGADAREVLHLATAGAGIETLHVAPLALFDGRGDVDLAEVLGADDVAGHLSQFFRGGDEAGYRHDACVDEELANLGYAADVLAPVLGREAEVGVDACADVVAVENAAEDAPPVQLALHTCCHGALAAAAEAGHPYHDAVLTEQRLFVLSAHHLVEDGVNYLIGHIKGITKTLMMKTMMFSGKPTLT